MTLRLRANVAPATRTSLQQPMYHFRGGGWVRACFPGTSAPCTTIGLSLARAVRAPGRSGVWCRVGRRRPRPSIHSSRIVASWFARTDSPPAEHADAKTFREVAEKTNEVGRGVAERGE